MGKDDGLKMAEMLARAGAGAPLGLAFDRLVQESSSDALYDAAKRLARVEHSGVALGAARKWVEWAKGPESPKSKYWRHLAVSLSTAGGLAWMRARDGELGAEGQEWMRGLKELEMALGARVKASLPQEACEELANLSWLGNASSAHEKARLATAWLSMGGKPDSKSKKLKGVGEGPPIVDWALGLEGGWPIALALGRGGAKPMRSSWGKGRHAAMQILCDDKLAASQRAGACVELCEMFGMGADAYQGKDKESMGMAAVKALSANPEAGAGICSELRARGVAVGAAEGDWLVVAAGKALGCGSGRHARKVMVLALEAHGLQARKVDFGPVLELARQARISCAMSVGYKQEEAAPEWADLLVDWARACGWGALEAGKLSEAWPALVKQPCFAAWRESLELDEAMGSACGPASPAKRSL